MPVFAQWIRVSAAAFLVLLYSKFKSTPTQFRTIIFASSDTPNVGDVSETKLTERQQKILNLIKESPTITGKQMSETLSISETDDHNAHFLATMPIHLAFIDEKAYLASIGKELGEGNKKDFGKDFGKETCYGKNY